MTAPATDRRFSVPEAAKRIGVHAETIRRAIRSGELVAHRDRLAPGGPYRIADSDLRAFVAKRRD